MTPTVRADAIERTAEEADRRRLQLIGELELLRRTADERRALAERLERSALDVDLDPVVGNWMAQRMQRFIVALHDQHRRECDVLLDDARRTREPIATHPQLFRTPVPPVRPSGPTRTTATTGIGRRSELVGDGDVPPTSTTEHADYRALTDTSSSAAVEQDALPCVNPEAPTCDSADIAPVELDADTESFWGTADSVRRLGVSRPVLLRIGAVFAAALAAVLHFA
jgi:hypothetical protein